MTATTIRHAEPHDAAPLARLAERTFRDAFESWNTPEDMAAHCTKNFGEAIQAREILDTEYETLVCEFGDELVGFVQLHWGVGPDCVAARRPAEILRFYVDGHWHGRGLAQQLMNELLARANLGGADQVWLGVWEHNPRAIAFYCKSGFQEVGELVFILGSDRQRDIILSRSITS